MPNLFNTAGSSVATSPVDTDAEEVQTIEVDWDAEVKADNPEADINVVLPIPPAGTYLWKVRLQQRGEDKENPYGSMTKDKNNPRPFLNAMIELELVDESSPHHGFKINDRLSSLVYDKRGTSPLHHFMNCIGEALPSVITMKELRDRVTNVLGAEPAPMVQAELEWKASIKTGPGKYDWTPVVTRMRDFPKDKESDGYSQTYIYADPKTKQKSEHRAVAYINKYWLQGQ